jgi:predicted deacylase
MGMVENAPGSSAPTKISRESRWVRAPRGGLVRREVKLGDTVERRQVLGHVSDIWGRGNLAVRSPSAGIVIGAAHHPRANQGDALFHIAEVEENGS